MSQIHFYVPNQVEVEIRRRAASKGLSLSRYVADLVQQEISDGWPAGYFEKVVGGWQGEPLERPAQSDFERRDEL